MLPAFRTTGSERLPLTEAQGRYAAVDVQARSDLPAFSNSAMDGYAVRFQDLEGASEPSPARLPLAGESRAGGEDPLPLPPGSAMRIFTGAVVPQGANAVVPQEQTRLAVDDVDFLQPVREGAHIRNRGSDLSAGTTMVHTGQRLGAGELGLLAAQGHAGVAVFRQPQVAIISTGDELRDVSEPLEAGQIVNSNAYALAALVRENGCHPIVLPNVPDDLDATVEAFRQALRADCVLSSGGVSVGDFDYVRAAFERCGVQANFWKVCIKPGKPLTFGQCGSVPVIGLPGNPVSAMVTFEVFVRPGLQKMLGSNKPFRTLRSVRLAKEHRHSVGRPEFARAKLVQDGTELVAHLHERQGSGSLTSVVDIDAYVLLDSQISHFSEGSYLSALVLRDELGSELSPFADLS